MTPVLSQRTPILPTETLTLGKEAMQIGALSKIVAVEGFVDPIATHLIILLTHRHHVDTLTRDQRDIPIILRHTCNDMIVRELPTLAHMTILYPDICILLREAYLHQGVLHKYGGMGLAVEVHDLTLIVLQILDAHG